MVVVPLAEFLGHLGQLLQRGEVAHPEQLFLEGAEESLDAAVALRVAEAGPETETCTLDRCFLRSQPRRRLGLGRRARGDSSAADSTYHGHLHEPPKTGTFYFALTP